MQASHYNLSSFFVFFKCRKEQIDYQRRHKKELVLRKKCCHKKPLNPRRFEKGQSQIDPRAVIWKLSHFGQKIDNCKNCPTCILLPALTKLYKVCSHASLLQLKRNPERIEGKKEKENEERNLEFAKLVLTPDILQSLPGKSYIREDSIMDDHIALSGKMKTLDYCLKMYERQRDRVLIFSYSTATLDIIQQYTKGKGYSHLRLDGSTPTRKRQDLIDQFQSDENIFLFLISTKAGGLGLNLTAANCVIIFDVNWNPSHDEQAQDRAFRIGQKKNVDVVRFVSRGTVEELMYARQVYKVHLTQALEKTKGSTMPQPARIFRGVDKDPNRKGELFGLENLLKFKDGSFMAEMWQATELPNTKNNTHQMYSVKAMSGMLPKLADEFGDFGNNSDMIMADSLARVSPKKDKSNLSTHYSKKNIGSTADRNIPSCRDMSTHITGIRHDAFLRNDCGDAAIKQGDQGFEEEMGAMSQMVHVTCQEVCKEISSDGEGNISIYKGKEVCGKNQSNFPTNISPANGGGGDSRLKLKKMNEVSRKSICNVIHLERDGASRERCHCEPGSNKHNTMNVQQSSINKPCVTTPIKRKGLFIGSVFNDQKRKLIDFASDGCYIPSYLRKGRKG